MNIDVKAMLSQEKMTPEHTALLNHCLDLVDNSRSYMSKNYGDWDERMRVWEAERGADKRDVAKAKNEEPQKMVVPLTFAQIQTFVSFAIILLGQRKRFYELEETGVEDQATREVNELILERDCRFNQFDLILFQFFLDLARFGLGVGKFRWVTEKRKIWVPAQPTTELGTVIEPEPGDGEWVEVTDYVGNRVHAINVFHFYPDTRLPLTRWQEGEFVASEEEHTTTAVKKKEIEGVFAGVKYVPEATNERFMKRSASNGSSRFEYMNLNDAESLKNMMCLTEMQIKLIPSEFDIGNGKKLGVEDFPVLYLVTIANDARIIQLEPLNYATDKFTYFVHQFTPDMHRQLNKSLAGSIDKLQEVVDWLINSRVSSVVRTLDNQLVVDQSAIDMKTVESRSRVILTKKSVGRQGVERFIKPLPVQDVTQNHFADAAEISRIMEKVSGVNENAMGSFHTGRRSATEARTVAQGAAARLIVIIRLAWVGALAPLGQCLLENLRVNLPPDQFAKIIGEVKAQDPSLWASFHRDPVSIAGNCDYFAFDGTTSGEKQYLAQSYQELLAIVLNNPQAALMLDIDVSKMLNEIYVLRGQPNIKAFAMDPVQRQQLMMQQMLLNGPPSQPGGGDPNTAPPTQ